MLKNTPVAGVPNGAGEPQGNATTCHADDTLVSGLAGCVQPNVAELCVNVGVVNTVGAEQPGFGAQVTFANQPAAFVVAFELNTNVKQPVGWEEVNEGGNVVPDKLANNVAVLVSPSNTVKISVAA